MPTTSDLRLGSIRGIRLAKWFVAGFVATYLLMLFLSVSYFDGRKWHRTVVWHFYLLMAMNAQTYSKSRFSQLNFSVYLASQTMQVVISVFVGLIVVGIVWIRSRKPS